MSLVIEPGIYREPVKRHLARLVPPQIWSIDSFGFVSVTNVPPPSLALPAVTLLAKIVAAPGLVRIAGSEASVGATIDGGQVTLRDVGGAVFFDPAAQGPDADVAIIYDTTDNYGVGYWATGENNTKIDVPPHIILGHELAHALQALEGRSTTRAADEADAVSVENQIRTSDTPPLPIRVGHDGGAKTKPKAAPTKTPPRSGKGCFVATAAYGSALHPVVEELRSFREEVLRPTRVGRDFFDHFYEVYERVSRPVVEAMAAEPGVHEVVRDWLVSPIVRYLRLGREFPDLPVEAAGPWAPFLARLRDDLEQFASAVPLPSGLGALDPAAAVEELVVALSYQLRTPTSRRRWLEQLQAAGELPLAVHPGEYDDLAARLADTGRTRGEVEAVLGPPPARRGPSPASRRASRLMGQAFGKDRGGLGETVAWRYTVTLRNADSDGATYLNLRVYYLAQPGGPENMGLVTLDDLQPGEVAVFPLCECSRLLSYYIEGDLVTPAGVTGSFTFPEQGSILGGSSPDPNPCEDSWAF